MTTYSTTREFSIPDFVKESKAKRKKILEAVWERRKKIYKQFWDRKHNNDTER